jgi:hypothetical protein
MRAALTSADLQRWEEHGATWRAREISDDRVLVELCTCYGEAVDLAESTAAEVIAYVRRAGSARGESAPGGSAGDQPA